MESLFSRVNGWKSLENKRKECRLLTYTGHLFNPWYPEWDLINIWDISHALAGVSRFGAHTPSTYSVAQHSVLVSRLCPPEHRLWGLLHDAAEAYIGDMISPVKRTLPEFIKLEKILQKAICEKFGLSWPEPPEVKAADQRAYASESISMRNTNIGDADHPRIKGKGLVPVFPLTAPQAEEVFLKEYNMITGSDIQPLDFKQLRDINERNRNL